MNKVCLILIPLLIIGFILGACAPAAPTSAPPAGETTAPPPAGTGTVEIRATDAPPTGVSRIDVTVSGIEVHKAGAAESSWVTVVAEGKTFNLVDIQGAEVFLGEKDIEAGQYTQIRLEVVEVLVTIEGQEITAKLPGDKLKVVRNWEVKAGEVTILTLDFEADKFVLLTGQGGAQVKPVLKLEVSQGERPLKTREEKAIEEEEKGAEQAPAIPHTLAGRDNCLSCHGESGFKPFPADHAGRTADTCTGCHQQSQ